MWGLHSAIDAEMGLSLFNKHTLRGRIGTPRKYNLIVEAMNAGMSTTSVTTPVITPVTTSVTTPVITPVTNSDYASVKAGDVFELQWTYRNNMLHFKMKCKGLGWCGVGFSTFGTGAGMAQYDIAVGGVAANMTGYLHVSLLTIKTLYFKRGDRMR